MKFSGPIEIYNGNPYVLVDAARAEKLQSGWRKPMPVVIQINSKPDEPWYINMMPIGDGSFYLYLHGDVRKASKTKVGDLVEVRIKFDKGYINGPQHPMPDWFWDSLQGNAKALEAWNMLPPSRQKEILRYFSWLKSEDAIERNLQKAMFVLSGNEGRFMARTWKEGR